MTYDDLTRHIGQPEATGVKIEDSALVTFFRWDCGCRAYERSEHVEIDLCAAHRLSLRGELE